MATEIVDGKLLQIRYVHPNAPGTGTGETYLEGDNGVDCWTLEQASNTVTGHAAGMEIRFINSGSFTGDTTARSFTNDGTGDQPIVFSGRNAANTVYENAYLNRGGVATTFAGKNMIVRYLDITSSVTTSTVVLDDAKSIIYNCKIMNTSTNSAGACVGLSITGGTAFNNYIENKVVTTSSITTGALYINRSNCFGNKVVTKNRGIRFNIANFCYNNLIIGDGVGSGIYMDDYQAIQMIENNTIYNFNYGIDCFAENSADNSTFIMNNLFHTISGINNPSDPSSCIALRTSKLQSDYLINAIGNRYYNCDNFMVEDKYNLNNVECTSDPFVYTDVNPSYDINPPDYSLNNIAGGGALCKNINSLALTWTWNH